MDNYAIQVQNLSKRYRVGQYVGYSTLRESIVDMFTSVFRHRNGRDASQGGKGNYIWPLQDVSFDVKRGEAIGIIGRNGAGKTTLLKVLSRITEPTKGRALIRGRVGSLLEVGTGFHPELTGRENVYLNGAVLGMKKKEIDRKFDEIVDFSGVRQFIDTPLKRFSSGMQVRLAFAVAAHLEPEILMVDEVLAVGDFEFQNKCLGKMEEVTGGGRTVLFVSHHMDMISSLCERCILLDSGKVIADGETSSVISKYIGAFITQGGERIFPEDTNKDIHIRRVAIMDKDGNPKTRFDVFEPITVEVEYEVNKEMVGAVVKTTVSRQAVALFTSFDTDDNVGLLRYRTPGRYRARFDLPCLLNAGNYTLSMGTGVIHRKMDQINDALSFEIEEVSLNSNFKGYAKKRAGIMAAHIVWKTENLTSDGNLIRPHDRSINVKMPDVKRDI